MSWLPNLTWFGTTICEREGEAEGVTFQLRWGRFVVQMCFARFERTTTDAADAR